MNFLYTILNFIRITQNINAQGFTENKNAAQEGGSVAGVARKELEKKSKQNVSTSDNYLTEPERKKTDIDKLKKDKKTIKRLEKVIKERKNFKSREFK